MKPKTLARLDLLAAAQEAQAQEALRRTTATLRQTEAQQEVLGTYRSRLAASWQGGAEVDAATAQRAARFGAGALTAAKQLAETQAQAARRLEGVTAELADLRARRRKLAERLTATNAAARAQVQGKLEQDLTNNFPATRRSGP